RFHAAFNRRFERFRAFYVWMLEGLLARRLIVPLVAGGVILAAGCLVPFVGRDFFPQVDAGLIQLHVRAPARTRIDETPRRSSRRSRTASAPSFPSATATSCSTTSAYRSGCSTLRSPTARRSASMTA